MLSRLSNLYYKLLGRGAKVQPQEQSILDAWRESLSETDRTVLDAQLASVGIVQRQAGGMKVVFFPKTDTQAGKETSSLFLNQLPDLHVADVFLSATGDASTDSMRVKIFLHRGRFFSIEFPKRPTRYLKLHHMDIQAVRVTKVVPLVIME